MHATVYVKRSENNFQELVLSVYVPLGSRSVPQAQRGLYELSLLPGLCGIFSDSSFLHFLPGFDLRNCFLTAAGDSEICVLSLT